MVAGPHTVLVIENRPHDGMTLVETLTEEGLRVHRQQSVVGGDHVLIVSEFVNARVRILTDAVLKRPLDRTVLVELVRSLLPRHVA